ncbi:hypothetical protein [Herbiconiux sp. UC225_62]|uniref:hypothetical protein n=1 Tax=Herbiconiux sp. UC225_62 TaxID=3350168 RepID=UPI0036D3CC59
MTVLVLTLGVAIWLLKRRFRRISARIGRPIMLAMQDSESGLDQLLSQGSPYKIPPFPGISWADDALMIWGTAVDTRPFATIPRTTILSAQIGTMRAVLPRPAIQLRVNGLARPLCLVLYGPSPLDVLPMGKARLRKTMKQMGLQNPSLDAPPTQGA